MDVVKPVREQCEPTRRIKKWMFPNCNKSKIVPFVGEKKMGLIFV